MQVACIYGVSVNLAKTLITAQFGIVLQSEWVTFKSVFIYKSVVTYSTKGYTYNVEPKFQKDIVRHNAVYGYSNPNNGINNNNCLNSLTKEISCAWLLP